MSLLYDDRPMVFSPKLATVLNSLNQAIILQQIHYWCKDINEVADRNFHEGHYWTYNSYTKWQQQFPWWSVDTIKRTILELEESGLVISGCFNKDPRDHTKWYRINYEAIEQLEADGGKMHQSNGAKCTNRTGQNAPIERGKMHRALPEINTETTTENKAVTVAQNNLTMERVPNPDTTPRHGFGRSANSKPEGEVSRKFGVNRGLPVKLNTVDKWKAPDLVSYFKQRWAQTYGVAHPYVSMAAEGAHMKRCLLDVYGPVKAKELIDKLFERRQEFETPEYPEVSLAAFRQDWIVRKLLNNTNVPVPQQIERVVADNRIFESAYQAWWLGGSREEYVASLGLDPNKVEWINDVS